MGTHNLNSKDINCVCDVIHGYNFYKVSWPLKVTENFIEFQYIYIEFR